MFIVLYVTAVLVSLVLQRQERRHQFELSQEYHRLGVEMPSAAPKIPRLESWLNVVLGIILSGFATLFLRMNFLRLREFADDPRLAPHGFEWELASVFLAAGIALVILGVRSLLRNKRYASSMGSTNH